MPKGTAYVAPVWVNNNEPDLSAENLNPVMAEIETLDKAVFWNTGNTYASGDVVLYAGAVYASLQDANSGHTPGATPTWWLQLASSGTTNAWDSGRTYALNSPCTKDGIPYRSLVAGNVGNDPATAADKWEVVGGSSQGVENFLKNALTKPNVTSVTATGLTSAAWSTDSSAAKLLAAGALKAVVPSSGTRTLDVALADLDAINVGLTWEVRFAYLIDTAGADGLVAVSLYDGTTDVATSLGALPYGGGLAQMIVGTVIPTTTLTGQRLRFTFSGAVGFNFYLAKASVGPKTAVLAPAIGATQTYPLTIGATTTAPTKGTVAEDIATYARHGDKMSWSYRLRQTTAGQAGSGTYLLPLPAGHSINLSKHPIGSTVGVGKISNTNTVDGAGTTTRPAFVIVYSSTQLSIADQPSGATSLIYFGSSDMPLSQYMVVDVNAEFTISEWSVNVNLAGDFTEYAANISTWDTADTAGAYSSPGYGTISKAALTVNRIKRVIFQRNIQTGDRIEVEASYDGRVWVPIHGFHLPGITDAGVGTMIYGGTNTGGGVGIVATGTNYVDVEFGKYYHIDPAGAGNSWSNASAASYWRVRKVSGGNMAEVPPVVRAEYKYFPAVTANQPINYSTKVEDTHNAVTTGASWKFTAPIDGVYEVCASVVAKAGVVTTYFLYLNNATHRPVGTAPAIGADYGTGLGGVHIRLKAGDFIDLRSDQANTNAYQTDVYRISIVRIGS